MKVLLGCLLSYLIGSIPTAYIFGKALKGLDIRDHGSGNVGASNVFRVLGKGPGAAVLALDILKGFIPVVVISWAFGLKEILQLLSLAMSAVAGHNWTIFLKFRGGKGIATSLGVLIGLTVRIPSILPVLFITLLSWGVCFLLTRFVSLASMVAACVLPLVMVFTHQPFEVVCLGALFCIFVMIRHKPNISRLLKGEEPRVPLVFPRRK